jgi:beta-glucosidase
VSENVPLRAQWEIYYPGFQAAVEAGVASIMCSYNRINNTYACENNQTLNTDLKGRMNYQGFIMSDWGATHSTEQAANNGLDMQMPDDSFFGQPLVDAVAAGNVTLERLDNMVFRILYSMFSVGIFDFPETGNLQTPALSPAHDLLARQLAEAANVLVKNDEGLLPIDTNKVTTIAVIGDDASTNAIAVGCGSGQVVLPYLVTPLQGIQNYLAASGIQVQIQYAPSEPLDQAQAIAKAADIAVVFVGTFSCEGSDRVNLSLPNGQDGLVEGIASVQPNTAVVVHTPGAVLMPWVDQVSAILIAFLPGQEDGNAIAATLFGAVNPSGKLPVTFPLTDDQVPANTTVQYPGIDNEADYSEGILVGYRWWDALGLTPLWPFGHGISYTSFAYSALNVTVGVSTC